MVGVAANLVLDVGVQEFVILGVIAHDPLEVAGALAFEHELSAAQFVQVFIAVHIAGRVGAVVDGVGVEPVEVRLHQAFEAHLGAADDVEGDLGLCSRRSREGGQQGECQGSAVEFHGEPWALGKMARRLRCKVCVNMTV